MHKGVGKDAKQGPSVHSRVLRGVGIRLQDHSNSKANDLSLVFGGIATHPFRGVEAETFMWGKTIDDVLPSELAVGQLRPLKMNQYKIDLAKTLAARALMALAH